MATRQELGLDHERGKRFLSLCNDLFPGLSRAKIGNYIGVTEASVRNFEAGKPISTIALASLAKFNANLNYLLIGGEGKRVLTSPTVSENLEGIDAWRDRALKAEARAEAAEARERALIERVVRAETLLEEREKKGSPATTTAPSTPVKEDSPPIRKTRGA